MFIRILALFDHRPFIWRCASYAEVHLFYCNMNTNQKRVEKMKKLVLVSIVLVMAFIAGCAGVNNEPSNKQSTTDSPVVESTKAADSVNNEVSSEPVTLKFYSFGNTLTNTEFQKLFVEPTKLKYPNITLERIETAEDVTPEQLITTGNIPDIIYTSSGPAYYRFLNMDIVEPLDELIAKHNLDISRIKPVILDSIKQFTPEGQIIALPLSFNHLITYYNKEIFDKFGVDYLTDEPQTWDELVEIGRKLTKKEDGIQYIGVNLGTPNYVIRSLDAGIVDPLTGKSAITSPDWVKVYEVLKKNYELPGYVGEDNKYVYDRKNFMVDRTIGIFTSFLANMIGPLEELRQQGTEFDWDLAPAPYFDKEQVGGSIHSLIISKQSKYKDQAFQVVSNILSDETQLLVARNGRVPSIVNAELEKEFGANIEVLKGKNIASVFKSVEKINNPPHELENELGALLTEAADDIALNGVDVNTALRKTDEKINQAIDTWEKSK